MKKANCFQFLEEYRRAIFFLFFLYAFIGPSSVEVDGVTKMVYRVAFPLILKCLSFTDAFFDACSADGCDAKNEILRHLYSV